MPKAPVRRTGAFVVKPGWIRTRVANAVVCESEDTGQER